MPTVKQRIMQEKGITGFSAQSRKPLTPVDTPVSFHKTTLMLLLEQKFHQPIQDLISPTRGGIYDLEAKLGVDATTISKWRKLIRRSNGN